MKFSNIKFFIKIQFVIVCLQVPFYVFSMEISQILNFEKMIESIDIRSAPTLEYYESINRFSEHPYSEYFPFASKYGQDLFRMNTSENISRTAKAVGGIQIISKNQSKLVWDKNPIAVSFDGKYIAECVNVSAIVIWDISEKCNWKYVASLPDDLDYSVSSIAFSFNEKTEISGNLDGRYLATGSIDGRVRVFYLNDLINMVSHGESNVKTFVRKWEFKSKIDSPIETIQFSQQNKYLIINSSVQIDIISFLERKLIQSFSVDSSTIKAVDCASDEKTIAIATAEGLINFLNIQNKECFISYQECIDSEITCIKFSPGGDLLVIGFDDGFFAILDIGMWSQRLNYSTYGAIRVITFSGDGNFIAIGSDDCVVKFYHTQTCQCIGAFTYPNIARFIYFQSMSRLIYRQVKTLGFRGEIYDGLILSPDMFSLKQLILIIKLQQNAAQYKQTQKDGHFLEGFTLDAYWQSIFNSLPGALIEFFTGHYKYL